MKNLIKSYFLLHANEKDEAKKDAILEELASRLETKEPKEVNFNQMFKEILAEKNMTRKDVSKKSGIIYDNLIVLMRKPTMTTKSLVKILRGLDEDLILCTSSGKQYLIHE